MSSTRSFIFSLFVVLFFNQSIYSQINIDVEYNVSVDENDDYLGKLNENAFLKNLIEGEIEKIDDYKFLLLINDSISSFFLSKDSRNQRVYFTEKSNKNIFVLNYTGTVYNINRTFYIFDNNFKLFSTNQYDYKWEILKETKEIDGFLCYKAKTIITIKNPAGYFSFPIVAWFCPELPYSFGPLYFDGLPGLILQLKYRGATFEASKINLKSTYNVNMEWFRQHKKLTLDDYTKYSDEKFKSSKKN